MNAIPGPILTPGIYDLPAATYHADPCPVPSLSNSIAKKLVRQSPMHAHYAHPRLGAAAYEAGNQAMNDGTILHNILLGKGGEIEVIVADDFRTKAAKEARDAAVAAGKTPVLSHKLNALHDTAAAARRQIETHPDARILFGAGDAERALIWEEDGTWFRSLVDWMPLDPALPLVDLKTTGMSAAPGEWERRLIHEYAFQDAFYARGYKALRGIYPPPMMFVVIETEAPHGISVMSAAPSLRAMAEAEVERAVQVWRHCMKTGQWPGYPPFIAYVEAPNWMLSRAEEQAMRDEFMQESAA